MENLNETAGTKTEAETTLHLLKTVSDAMIESNSTRTVSVSSIGTDAAGRTICETCGTVISLWQDKCNVCNATFDWNDFIFPEA